MGGAKTNVCCARASTGRPWRVGGTALEIAGFVRGYADENELDNLAVKVRVTSSDFRRVHPGQRIWLARQIHDAAQPVVAALASCGVTPTRLADLQAKIDAATAASSKPRISTVAKRVATARMVATLKEADAILENRTDPLILPLRTTTPGLYAAYRAARTIFDRPGGRSGPPAESNGGKEGRLVVSAQRRAKARRFF